MEQAVPVVVPIYLSGLVRLRSDRSGSSIRRDSEILMSRTALSAVLRAAAARRCISKSLSSSPIFSGELGTFVYTAAMNLAG